MNKSTIIREFDEKAAHYEDYRLGGWYTAQLDLLSQRIDEDVRGDHLDIGCGTGWLLRRLATRNPDRRYIGIDISPGMIERARSLLTDDIDNVEFRTGDWEKLDLSALAGYRFGRVTCTSAFHYFSDPNRSVKKMHASLESDGLLYLIERDKKASLITVFWDLLHRTLIRDHVKFYSVDELTAIMRASGFSDIETLETINRYFWHGKMQTNVVLLGARKSSVE